MNERGNGLETGGNTRIEGGGNEELRQVSIIKNKKKSQEMGEQPKEQTHNFLAQVLSTLSAREKMKIPNIHPVEGQERRHKKSEEGEEPIRGSQEGQLTR